ncbi:FG-GAP-like repeat-containing protein [Streptomyces sp. NPDC020681]|uniref:FG-GAP-like repeat-containing protein n=1 Tax=Streptomyces sp. NPDC020681 TaxID=3365083 RepID=UPI00379393B6
MAAGLLGVSGGVASAAPAADGSTVSLDTPDVPTGGKVTHTVTVHAVASGTLSVTFAAAQDQRWWDSDEEWTLGVQASGADARCVFPASLVAGVLSCSLPAGDHTITYTMSASAAAEAWKVDVDAGFDDGADRPVADSRFAVLGGREPAMDYWLYGRTPAGAVRAHGTYVGEFGPLDPEWSSQVQASGWDRYDVATKTAPINVRGVGGDVVARRKDGHLWFYPAMPGDSGGFRYPTDVGGGWSQYTAVRGAGDLSGDAEPDLITRGADGTLWLYKGTGRNSAPFTARTKIGSGWNIYTSLTGGTDLTGDRAADLLARDAAGGFWLYEGTGNAAAPLKARVKVGSGWNIYNALVAYGDASGDGHPDLIARDAAGVLWQYGGTGEAALPFTARVRVNQYWGQYNALF